MGYVHITYDLSFFSNGSTNGGYLYIDNDKEIALNSGDEELWIEIENGTHSIIYDNIGHSMRRKYERDISGALMLDSLNATKKGLNALDSLQNASANLNFFEFDSNSVLNVSFDMEVDTKTGIPRMKLKPPSFCLTNSDMITIQQSIERAKSNYKAKRNKKSFGLLLRFLAIVASIGFVIFSFTCFSAGTLWSVVILGAVFGLFHPEDW